MNLQEGHGPFQEGSQGKAREEAEEGEVEAWDGLSTQVEKQKSWEEEGGQGVEAGNGADDQKGSAVAFWCVLFDKTQCLTTLGHEKHEKYIRPIGRMLENHVFPRVCCRTDA